MRYCIGPLSKGIFRFMGYGFSCLRFVGRAPSSVLDVTKRAGLLVAVVAGQAVDAQTVVKPEAGILLEEIKVDTKVRDVFGEFPAVQETKVFALEKPLRDGSNAITTLKFDRKKAERFFRGKPVFESRIDNEVLKFNDMGEGADIEPDDGVFSTFSRIDFDKIRENEERVVKRMLNSEVREVTEFSGRSVVRRKPFHIEKLLESRPKEEVIKLPNGLRAFRVPLIFNKGNPLPFTADEGKVLAINNTSVVADPVLTYDPCDTDAVGNDFNPDAPWSFKTLISNLNQGTGLTDQEFAHQWLSNWINDTTVNTFTIPKREQITDYFPGWDGQNASTLDMDNLPFRLLAVVNRIDLAKVSYTGSSEGEIRFVFGLLNPNTCTPAGVFDQMTAIFEYGDTASSCSSIKSRAQQWLDLDDEVMGSNAYLTQLKQITDDVTQAPQAASALNQLRTNDFGFDGIGNLGQWELREFVIDTGSGLLEPTTTKQTPHQSFRSSHPLTALYMEQNANSILCESHVVPETFDNTPFLGGHLQYVGNTFWTAPTQQSNLPSSFPSCHDNSGSNVSSFLTLADEIQSEVRHKFSVNACDDCHARETDTNFTHINPMTRGLSGFMTGISVDDPLLGSGAVAGVTREFDDLERRGQVLMDLVASSCSGGIIFGTNFVQKTVPLNIVH